MTYQVWLQPDEVRLCKDSLFKLREDPFRRRSGCDIKKLEGYRKKLYRLRVGKHRFEYFVKEKDVVVYQAFHRERGYR
jgi:mRNA-degrading endonuclease RelE of RelBE toxin-antitoxin system